VFENRIAYLVAPGKFELAEETIDAIPDDRILVRNRACGICQGTEIWFWKGIDCDSGKAVQYPRLLGHQNAGEVVAVGENVTCIEIGDRLTGSGAKGYQVYSVADPSRCVPIPDRITYEQASQAIELGSIIKEVDRASIRVDDKVVVIGAGPMGNLLIQVVRLRSPQIIIATDLHDSRLQLAHRLGADYVVNAAKEDQVQRVKEITGDGATVVFEATTNVTCLKLAIDMLKVEGRLVVFGTHPEAIDIRADVFKRKSCTVYYTFPTPEEWKMYTERGIELLRTGGIDVASLVSHRFGLEQINEAFTLLEESAHEVMKAIFVP